MSSLRNYRIELVVKPSITSHFQGFETVLCLVCVLALFKFIKEIFSDGDCVCCIQRNKSDRNSRMNHLNIQILSGHQHIFLYDFNQLNRDYIMAPPQKILTSIKNVEIIFWVLRWEDKSVVLCIRKCVSDLVCCKRVSEYIEFCKRVSIVVCVHVATVTTLASHAGRWSILRTTTCWVAWPYTPTHYIYTLHVLFQVRVIH